MEFYLVILADFDENAKFNYISESHFYIKHWVTQGVQTKLHIVQFMVKI